jgi:AFG3 family protein
LRSYAGDEGGFSKPFSEATEMKIDNEVRKLIDEALVKTREIVRTYKAEIEMYFK